MDVQQFDRNISLSDLLAAVPLIKVQSALTAMLGGRWGIVDTEGQLLLGKGAKTRHDTMALPLYLEITVIDKLAVNGARREQLMSAATWLGIVLADAHRYLIMADLHRDAVRAGDENLRCQQQALQAANGSNREPATQLEKMQAPLLQLKQMQELVLAVRRGELEYAGLDLALQELRSLLAEANLDESALVNPEN
ncbi:MAG: hypothetical protein V4634_12715 [Pseudomonadota bacterium]